MNHTCVVHQHKCLNCNEVWKHCPCAPTKDALIKMHQCPKCGKEEWWKYKENGMIVCEEVQVEGPQYIDYFEAMMQSAHCSAQHEMKRR